MYVQFTEDPTGIVNTDGTVEEKVADKMKIGEKVADKINIGEKVADKMNIGEKAYVKKMENKTNEKGT